MERPNNGPGRATLTQLHQNQDCFSASLRNHFHIKATEIVVLEVEMQFLNRKKDHGEFNN